MKTKLKNGIMFISHKSNWKNTQYDQMHNYETKLVYLMIVLENFLRLGVF